MTARVQLQRRFRRSRAREGQRGRDDLGADVFAQTRLALDVVGNVLAVTDARGNLAEAREHGLLRQALRVTSEDAGERRVLRSVLGAPHRAWNARGFVTTLHYDDAHRPLSTVVTRPDASTFTAVRMLYGESVPAPEASNLRGQVFRIYDGAGLQQSNALDFAGNLISQTRQLTVAYDATPSWSVLDGLTAIVDLDTAAAALLQAETFTTTATFDALGRPVTQTTPDASVTHLAYDDGGKLLTVDANVRGAVTATDFVTAIEYDARGQRQRIDYGNGTRTDYEHDPLTFRLRRLHTTNTAGTVTHQDLRYTFDPVGNITEIRDLAQPVVFTSNAAVSADQRFTYDALYRLIEAEGREHGTQGQPIAADFIPRAAPDDPTGLRAYVEHFTYDLVGNILQLQHQATGGSWTRHYDYAATGNRLLATSAPGDGPGVLSHAYQYNAHGSMTAMPHLAAVDWDHADRMHSADLGGGGTVWFLYDSAGNRVRKIRVNQAGTSTYERIYVGGYEVYREHVDTELRLERQTLHIADDTGRICLVETKTVEDADVVPLPANISRYQYGNHLGSVGLELDETGQLISYEEFHPYGTTAYRAANSAVDVSPSRYRYTGKERDEETGLGHHGARYYASWLARWTASDPVGLGDGVNRFAYASGRPVVLVDLDGTMAKPVQEVDFSDEPLVVAGDPAAQKSGSASESFTATRVEPNRRMSFGQYQAVRRPTTGFVGGDFAARGTGVGPGRETNTDSHGYKDKGPSHTSQVDPIRSLVPVGGPLADAHANLQDLAQADNTLEAVGYGALAAANAALAVLDVFSLGAASAERAALRSMGVELLYTAGSKEVGRNAARRTGQEVVTNAGDARPRDPGDLAAKGGVPKWVENLPDKVRAQIDKAELPLTGETPFQPKLVTKHGKQQIETAEVPHGPRQGERGRVDTEGRIWLRDKPHAGYPAHWDVQLDGGRSHTNVGFDGNPLKRNF